jgi:hypothetical protein
MARESRNLPSATSIEIFPPLSPTTDLVVSETGFVTTPGGVPIVDHLEVFLDGQQALTDLQLGARGDFEFTLDLLAYGDHVLVVDPVGRNAAGDRVFLVTDQPLLVNKVESRPFLGIGNQPGTLVPGSSIQLCLLDASGSCLVRSPRDVTWASSNDAVATVLDGWVTALGPGTTQVSAEYPVTEWLPGGHVETIGLTVASWADCRPGENYLEGPLAIQVPFRDVSLLEGPATQKYPNGSSFVDVYFLPVVPPTTLVSWLWEIPGRPGTHVASDYVGAFVVGNGARSLSVLYSWPRADGTCCESVHATAGTGTIRELTSLPTGHIRGSFEVTVPYPPGSSSPLRACLDSDLPVSIR